MKVLIGKYRVSAYYLITLLLSGVLLSLHTLFPAAGNYSVSFPQVAPGVAVMILGIVLKKEGIGRQIKDYFRWDQDFLKWGVVVLAMAILLIVPSGLIVSLLGKQYEPWSGTVVVYSISTVAVMIGCVIEEIGWRGFVLPNLQKRFSLFVSSVIVGMMWGVWHFNFGSGMIGYLLYNFNCIELSIIMTWVFNKSHKNLGLMVLFHFMINMLSRLFLWERFGLMLYVVQSIVYGIVCIIIVVGNKKMYFGQSQVGKNRE